MQQTCAQAADSFCDSDGFSLTLVCNSDCVHRSFHSLNSDWSLSSTSLLLFSSSPMSLPVGDVTLSGLQQAATLGTLPTLIPAVLRSALTGERKEKDSKGNNSLEYKAAFGALLTLILEAARSDAAPADLTPVLEGAGWSSAAISEVVAQFGANKETLRGGAAASPSAAASAIPAAASAALPLSSLSSTSFPSIVGIEWRVDAYLRSDALDAVRAPSFLLSLQTQQPGAPAGAAPQCIPFSCNFQQLQDLLAKLKDAQKQIQQRVE
jgi:hypothetical protein